MFGRVIFNSFRALQGRTVRSFLRPSCSRLLSEVRPERPFQATANENGLSVDWQDANSRFHYVWLRHHCPCPACLDPNTKQRTIDVALIPPHIKPQELNVNKNELQIKWEDGHESCFESSWLKENAYDVFRGKNTGFGSIADESELMLWNKEIIDANPPPEYSFNELEKNPSLVLSALDNLFRYGILFVNETPCDEESLAKLCEIIGGVVQETLYGRVYVLENKDLALSDIAYLSHALHGHTDHTYFEAPAGIQVMHCTHHNGTGGLSLLVDGFNAAKMLYEEDPEAYRILTTTQVPFEYNSKHQMTRVHGTLLEVDPFKQQLIRLRYNNSRVGPFTNMNLSYEEMEKFYQAVHLFGSIVRRPENEYWFKLTPGRVVVMDNRRTLHGRSEVSGSRILMGCYVSNDDYIGKWRAMKAADTQI